MNEKIPVVDAIGAAYRFAFGRLGAVIGTAWLPILILLVLTTTLTAVAMPAVFAGQPQPAMVFAQLSRLVMVYPVLLLITLVFGGMASAGMMGVALGRKQPGWVYFSFGAPVRRMIAAYFVMYGVLILLTVVLYAVFLAASYGAGMPVPAPNALLISWVTHPFTQFVMCDIIPGHCPSAGVRVGLGFLGFVEFCVLIYTSIRLTFFLAAVVVGEEKVGVGRAWALGGSNFWRIVGVMVCTVLPIAVATAIGEHYATRAFVAAGIAHGVGGAAEIHGIALALHGAPLVLLISTAIGFVDRILTLGLISGAAASAYTEVTASRELQH
jgi:hypothetical protein